MRKLKPATQKAPQMIRFIFILLVLWPACLQAQPADEQLAGQYFNNGEFDKALMYYEKLYQRNATDYYYSFYFKCLVETKRFDDAEKLNKKQSKKSGTPEYFEIDMGTLYEAKGETAKANEQYKKAIASLPQIDKRYTDLGKTFIELMRPDLALATYQQGEKTLKFSNFAIEKAEAYAALGQTREMLNEYFNLLEKDERKMPTVQMLISNQLDFTNPADSSVEYHRTELLRRVQKNPQKHFYSELLVWHFIQVKDFETALMHVIALDKRRKSMGSDVLNLGFMCARNKYFDVANKAFQYVQDTHPEGPYTMQARTEQLSVLYEKVTSSSYTNSELQKLETLYTEALSNKQLGRNPQTIKQLRELAHIKGFYLKKIDEAIDLLQQGIEIPGIQKRTKSELKLDLADLFVFSGDIWEASLLYMQVEKEFKEDPLGHEAKFRNAKVFYYSGSFDYAKAQLDVLKASTSKLISNDAIHLSLLIMDNLAFDTTIRPLQLYAAADLMIYQNHLDKAKTYLDSLNNEYPFHSLSDEVYFKRYEIAIKNRDYHKAAEWLKKIVEEHPRDIIADDALFYLGDIYQYQFHNEKEAVGYYKKLLFEYTGSLYVVEARKRFRELTEKKPDLLQPDVDETLFEPWPERPDPDWLFERGVDRRQYEELRKNRLK